MIKLTLDIEPVAWGRVRRGRYGQAYVPPKTRHFESAARSLMRKATWQLPIPEGPLKLKARFVLKKPKRPKNRTEPMVRPDLDNYLKALKDSANGILWHDDAQVVHVDARKLYDMSGGNPRIEIEVTAAEPAKERE